MLITLWHHGAILRWVVTSSISGVGGDGRLKNVNKLINPGALKSYVLNKLRIVLLHSLIKKVETNIETNHVDTLVARFVAPAWGPCGTDRAQVGHMLTPWTLLVGYVICLHQVQQLPLF